MSLQIVPINEVFVVGLCFFSLWAPATILRTHIYFVKLDYKLFVSPAASPEE